MSNNNDFVSGTGKTIDITIKAAKLTSDILADALKDFLSDKTTKKGRMTFKELEAQNPNSKLESIEITDNNIRDFLATAKKYNVDYALKRDKSTEPVTYHVFFQSFKAENFNRAFKEYTSIKQKQIEEKKTPYDRQKLNEKAKEIASEAREKKEKVRERTFDNSL